MVGTSPTMTEVKNDPDKNFWERKRSMASYENFTVETDADGIALVTWDMPDRSMNIFTEEVMDELETLVGREGLQLLYDPAGLHGGAPAH